MIYSIPIDTEFPSITLDSTIFDVGAFHGTWSAAIAAKYGPARVHAFEPVPAYADAAEAACAGMDSVTVHRFALGGCSRAERLAVADLASSYVMKPDLPISEEISIQVESLSDFLARESIKEVSVAKINIEGAEYELLDAVLDGGYAPMFGELLVQFHTGPSRANARRMMIQKRLAATHICVYSIPWMWERWRRISLGT